MKSGRRELYKAESNLKVLLKTVAFVNKIKALDDIK